MPVCPLPLADKIVLSGHVIQSAPPPPLHVLQLAEQAIQAFDDESP